MPQSVISLQNFIALFALANGYVSIVFFNYIVCQLQSLLSKFNHKLDRFISDIIVCCSTMPNVLNQIRRMSFTDMYDVYKLQKDS